MKLWNKFINIIWSVDEPISTEESSRIFCAVVMLFWLLIVILNDYQVF